MALTGKTFRIFVSSTFSDLKEERNALQEKVFPRLKELCLQHGCRFQAVDLRWGVREEAGLDQQTMKICLGEIERCQKITPRPNFIVLLGDRYGWRPLPPDIPAGEFEQIRKARDRSRGDRHCCRDGTVATTTPCPRSIACGRAGSRSKRTPVTKSGAGPWTKKPRQWNEVEGRLRGILRSRGRASSSFIRRARDEVPGLGHRAGDRSRGHEGGRRRKARLLLFPRRSKGFPRTRAPAIFTDLDEDGAVDGEARRRLAALKDRLRSRLNDNVHEYKAAWQQDRGLDRPSGQPCAKTCGERSRSHPERNHAHWGQSIRWTRRSPTTRPSAGRGPGSSSAGKTYLQGHRGLPESARAKLRLALFGASGSGKSALLAKAIEQARQSHPERRDRRPASSAPPPPRATSARCWKGCAGRSPAPTAATSRPSPANTRSWPKSSPSGWPWPRPRSPSSCFSTPWTSSRKATTPAASSGCRPPCPTTCVSWSRPLRPTAGRP